MAWNSGFINNVSKVNQYLCPRALLMDGDIKKNNNLLEALKFPPGLNQSLGFYTSEARKHFLIWKYQIREKLQSSVGKWENTGLHFSPTFQCSFCIHRPKPLFKVGFARVNFRNFRNFRGARQGRNCGLRPCREQGAEIPGLLWDVIARTLSGIGIFVFLLTCWICVPFPRQDPLFVVFLLLLLLFFGAFLENLSHLCLSLAAVPACSDVCPLSVPALELSLPFVPAEKWIIRSAAREKQPGKQLQSSCDAFGSLDASWRNSSFLPQDFLSHFQFQAAISSSFKPLALVVVMNSRSLLNFPSLCRCLCPGPGQRANRER